LCPAGSLPEVLSWEMCSLNDTLLCWSCLFVVVFFLLLLLFFIFLFSYFILKQYWHWYHACITFWMQVVIFRNMCQTILLKVSCMHNIYTWTKVVIFCTNTSCIKDIEHHTALKYTNQCVYSYNQNTSICL
jgi:hypothetical protein